MARVSVVSLDPLRSGIVGVGIGIDGMPSVEVLLEGAAAVRSPDRVERLLVLHRAECRTLEQQREVEVAVRGVEAQAEVHPRGLVEGERVLVERVDLAVAVPVHILVVSGQDVAVLVDVVRPDVLPAFVAAGRFVAELYALVAVRQVVVAPAVVGVAPRTLLGGGQVLVARDRGDGLDVVGELPDAVAVGQLELEAELAVAVEVFTRGRGADHRRQVARAACEHALAVAVEVVEREAEQAVPTLEVHTDVERVGGVPRDVLVGQGERGGGIDEFAAEDVARGILVVVSLLGVAARGGIGVSRGPVVLQVAVVTEHAVAGAELQLVDEREEVAVLDERLFGDAPSGRYRGEEAPLVSLGELRRSVVAELCLDQVAVVEVVVHTADECLVGQFVDVVVAARHAAQLARIDTGHQVGRAVGQVALCVEVVADALLDLPADESADVVPAEGAVVVDDELPEHLLLAVLLAAQLARRAAVVDDVVVGVGVLVIGIEVILLAVDLVVVEPVVEAEEPLGRESLQGGCEGAEVEVQRSRRLEELLVVLAVSGDVRIHHGDGILLQVE